MQIISTPLSLSAIGPYSQAVQVGDFIYLSGQIALDPKTMKMKQGSIEEECEQIIANIRNIVESAGSTLLGIVKTTIFLTDISDFQKVNEVYAKYLTQKPARSTVAVSALPKGARIEIECIVYTGK